MYRPVDQSQNSRPNRRHNETVSSAHGYRKPAKWKKLIFIGFVIYLLFIGKGIYSQEKTIIEKQQEVEILDQEFKAVKLENDLLEGRSKRLHDEDYIAEIARQNYYLSKPGEMLFIIPPEGR